MKRIVAFLVKISATAFLFYLLFRKVDFQQFSATLRHARMGLLLLAFLILWVGHYICIFRWRMLMRPLMPALSIGRLFGIYCIGLFFNIVLPSLVGGDVVKMYYAGKPSKLYARSFAATFLDRDAGMLAMMIIACTATLIHPVSIVKIPVSLIVWASSLFFLSANIAIFTRSLHRLVTRALHKLRLSKIAAKIDTVSETFQIMAKARAALLGSLAISLVNQIMVIVDIWILSEGLRLHVSILYFLVFVPVITLVSMIPISLNGMGLREYAFLSLFSAIGVPPASSIALGLLSSVVIILSAIPGGVIYLFFRAQSDVQEMATLEADFS